MGTLPTIEVANPNGGVMIINKSDYDPAIHKLPGEPKAKRTRKPQAPKGGEDAVE